MPHNTDRGKPLIGGSTSLLMICNNSETVAWCSATCTSHFLSILIDHFFNPYSQVSPLLSREWDCCSIWYCCICCAHRTTASVSGLARTSNWVEVGRVLLVPPVAAARPWEVQRRTWEPCQSIRWASAPVACSRPIPLLLAQRVIVAVEFIHPLEGFN